MESARPRPPPSKRPRLLNPVPIDIDALDAPINVDALDTSIDVDGIESDGEVIFVGAEDEVTDGGGADDHVAVVEEQAGGEKRSGDDWGVGVDVDPGCVPLT